jgi:hypothetical protein
MVYFEKVILMHRPGFHWHGKCEVREPFTIGVCFDRHLHNLLKDMCALVLRDRQAGRPAIARCHGPGSGGSSSLNVMRGELRVVVHVNVVPQEKGLAGRWRRGECVENRTSCIRVEIVSNDRAKIKTETLWHGHFFVAASVVVHDRSWCYTVALGKGANTVNCSSCCCASRSTSSGRRLQSPITERKVTCCVLGRLFFPRLFSSMLTERNVTC